MTRPSSTDPLIGTTIGGYKIIERLGRGGMGAVYKATQQSLDRTVALKVLSPKLAADPAFVRKFSDEAQAAGRLDHPNIVQVYDVGHDGTHHFYSMEYIERGSVQALLDAKPGPSTRTSRSRS
jgi:serine/threonine protein kinase